jgi:hypothetical protein
MTVFENLLRALCIVLTINTAIEYRPKTSGSTKAPSSRRSPLKASTLTAEEMNIHPPKSISSWRALFSQRKRFECPLIQV